MKVKRKRKKKRKKGPEGGRFPLLEYSYSTRTKKSKVRASNLSSMLIVLRFVTKRIIEILA